MPLAPLPPERWPDPLPYQELLQPVDSNPARIVEDAYATPATIGSEHPVPDGVSQGRFEEFLIERMNWQPATSQGGGVIQVGEDTVFDTTREWGDRVWEGYHSRLVLAGVGLAIFALNACTVVDDGAHVGKEIGKGVASVGRGIGHGAQDIYNGVTSGLEVIFGDDGSVIGFAPKPEVCPPTIIPGQPTTKHEFIHIGTKEVNGNQPSPDAVTHAVEIIEARQKVDENLEAKVRGDTSDEWRAKADLGSEKPDTENDDLGTKLQKNTETAIKEGLGSDHVTFVKPKPSALEHILNDRQLKKVNKVLGKHGFDLREALNIFDADPNSLPKQVLKTMTKYYGKYRGATLELIYQVPGKPTPGEPNCPPNNTPPTDGGGGNQPPSSSSEKGFDWGNFNWWSLLPLAFLVPLRRRISTTVEKTIPRFAPIPENMPNPEFLLVHPNALRPVRGVSREHEPTNGRELVHETWAYTRKNWNLLRESERIKGVYRYGYINSDGEEQTLRAQFIDHEASDETLAMFNRLFEQVSQIEIKDKKTGKIRRIADDLSMVTVYKSDNAGRHGRAKDVALGYEVQYEGNVLGVAIPGTGEVQMHMPADPTEEELNNFLGAFFTAWHEVGGHFSDLNDAENIITEILPAAGSQPAVYALSNRFENNAQDIFDQFEEARRRKEPLKWTIRRVLQNIPGALITKKQIVETNDPRLTEAKFVRKESNFSPYGETGAPEEWAESAANYGTGIGRPITDEPAASNIQTEDGFADTYHASTAMHQLLAERWGADPDSDELVFNTNVVRTQSSYVPMDMDELMVRLADEARRTPLPPRRELLHIITGTRIHAHEEA